MAGINYTEEQIKELKNNKYINNCTKKYIIFTKEFKYKVLKLYDEGRYIKKIFEISGFPDYVTNSKTPKRCLDRWKRNRMHKGIIEEKKGRRKKEKFDISKMTKDEELEYLRAENAYLKELKKLVDGNYP